LDVHAIEFETNVPLIHRDHRHSPGSRKPARRKSESVFRITSGWGDTANGGFVGSGGNTSQWPLLVRSMRKPCFRASRNRSSRRILPLSPENVKGLASWERTEPKVAEGNDTLGDGPR